MNTSEVLNRAADLIQERGWATGGMDVDPWGGGAATDAPVCLEGGIAAAMGVHNPDEVGVYEELVTCPAYKAVRRYLGLGSDSLIFLWNDKRGRTASEVIEVLRAAAVIEQARESQPVEQSA